ncbi:MAG: hypothetical protein E5W49_04655 [Mesorhizobium sp.]|nr:MAG: hypothetical protein E5W49_04655 [Mesorhizobium sp.]
MTGINHNAGKAFLRHEFDRAGVNRGVAEKDKILSSDLLYKCSGIVGCSTAMHAIDICQNHQLWCPS